MSPGIACFVTGEDGSSRVTISGCPSFGTQDTTRIGDGRAVEAGGTVLQRLRSVGTYESKPFYFWKGRRKGDFDPFPKQGFITGADGGLVSCGEFENDHGSKCLVLVNRNMNRPVEITPRLAWERITEITKYDRERCAWGDKPVWRAPPRLRLVPRDGVFAGATLQK